jgi:exopolyphosphatase/guanosine-5'-triphosphate,3'-diphosphate pyrophosphatase
MLNDLRMRVATIDIGTNTVLLLVAEQAADGSLVPVTECATITRLGEGVDRTRRFAPAAVARTRTCLEEYARTVQALGVERIAVVGTSAMRDAGGGDEVQAHVHAAFDMDARVVSGEEEARLAFRGALSGLAAAGQGETAVFDIGGGSTEVVLGRADAGGLKLAFAESFNRGSVRLTERYLAHDPPTPSELASLTQSLREAFAAVPMFAGGRPPVGVAGTMTTLAAVSLGLVPYEGARVHGLTIAHDELRTLVGRLESMDLESRRRLPGMEPKRADVIVAGGWIALSLLEHWGADSAQISDRGVRWGLAQELIEGI